MLRPSILALCWMLATVLGQQAFGDDALIRATALQLQAATVRVRTGSDCSSGVLVNPPGRVLTVAHGLPATAVSAVVVTFDGRQFEADVTTRDDDTDVAVLHIRESDTSKLPAGLTHFRPGQLPATSVVLAAGYPGREADGLTPVLRRGVVVSFGERDFRSSCQLTAGDSGGPVVDAHGQLVGLNLKIGAGTQQNRHLTMEAVSRSPARPMHDLLISTEENRDDESTQPPSAITSSAQRTIVLRTNNPLIASNATIGGLMLNDELVATKLSALGGQTVIKSNLPNERDAHVVGEDRALDLAILRLSTPMADIPNLLDPAHSKTAASVIPGETVFVMTGRSTEAQVGLISRVEHCEIGHTAFFGAELQRQDETGAIQIQEVAPNSAAAVADIKAGSSLTAINGKPVLTLDEIGDAFKALQPGDWIEVTTHADGDLKSHLVQLQGDPGAAFDRSEHLAGLSGLLSSRRTGFDNVIQHDIPLLPQSCGSALLNCEGQIAGLNIARRGRESTLAVPIAKVLELARSVTSAEASPR